MTRLKTLGLMLLMAVTTTAVLSPSASALELPQNLPGAERVWTGSASEFFINVEISSNVDCEKVTSEGSEETSNPPKGLFHIHFKECTSKIAGTTVKCTGLGESQAGTILALGKWNLVWDRKKGGGFELTTALLYLFEPLHFTCSIVLIELKGSALCLDLNPAEKNATRSDHCIAEGTKETEEWCKKDVNGCLEPVVPKLEVSENHGEVKEAALLGLESRTYGVELFADI